MATISAAIRALQQKSALKRAAGGATLLGGPRVTLLGEVVELAQPTHACVLALLEQLTLTLALLEQLTLSLAPTLNLAVAPALALAPTVTRCVLALLELRAEYEQLGDAHEESRMVASHLSSAEQVRG